MATEQTDFTQGSILKKLCWFMLPVLGALVLQAAYGAVDLLVVGRCGSTSGLSAVSTGSQVLNLVTFVVTQLAMGSPSSSPGIWGKSARSRSAPSSAARRLYSHCFLSACSQRWFSLPAPSLYSCRLLLKQSL